jgi:hypothetical protein
LPTFCRHNRFVQNCPVCSREAAAEAPAGRPSPGRRERQAASGSGRRRGGELRVRRVARTSDDGYRHALVPGVKSSEAARRLSEEIAWAAGRLVVLGTAPSGLYADIAAEPDAEEAAWLTFLVAYLCPLEAEDPFGAIAAVRTTWASGEPVLLDGVATGPRTSHDPGHGERTLAAYRAWAARGGSQHAALTGEPGWTPERRFARSLERLALPGLTRDARYEFLVLLGRLGVAALQPSELALGGADETTLAAKRVFGIGDKLLLERRARDLATACDVPLEALDLALFNWGRDAPRATLGVPEPDPPAELEARTAGALGL